MENQVKKCKRASRIGIVGALFGCVLLTLTASAIAKSDKSSKHSSKDKGPKISSVLVSYDGQSPSCSAGDDHISIFGNGFDGPDRTKVTLGEFGKLNICPESTDSQLIVQCPLGACISGDYLLKVSTGKGTSKKRTDSYDLTIGATGAKGPQGPRGEAGADGKDGFHGKDGIDGADGANGLNGKNGMNGMPGEHGPQGPPGVFNISRQVGSFIEESVPPGGRVERSVNCPAGQTVLGGGGNVTSTGNGNGRVAMTASQPDGTTGWYVQGKNVDSIDLIVRVEPIAMCAELN